MFNCIVLSCVAACYSVVHTCGLSTIELKAIRHFKTHYFQQAFSSPSYLTPCVSDSPFADIVRVYKFHLLTYLLTYLLIITQWYDGQFCKQGCINLHIFDARVQNKVIGGREHWLVSGRRKQVRTIAGDISVRTLSRVHWGRYRTQDWRPVDLCADPHPKRQYQTGGYTEVGALYKASTIYDTIKLYDGALKS